MKCVSCLFLWTRLSTTEWSCWKWASTCQPLFCSVVACIVMLWHWCSWHVSHSHVQSQLYDFCDARLHFADNLCTFSDVNVVNWELLMAQTFRLPHHTFYRDNEYYTLDKEELQDMSSMVIFYVLRLSYGICRYSLAIGIVEWCSISAVEMWEGLCFFLHVRNVSCTCTYLTLSYV